MNDVTRDPEVFTPSPPRRRTGGGWFDPAEPHPYRGPFSRWPRGADAALAVIVFASSLIAVAVSALDDGDAFTIDSIGDRPAAAVVLLGLAAAALLWRRQYPIAVTIFVLVVMVGWGVAGYGDGHEFALVVAMYSVGRYATDHRFSLAAVGVATAVDILGTIIDSHQRIDIAPAIVLTALPWYVGRRIRNRNDYLALLQQRAERLAAEQQARARQAVADERSRIARELHDVVAHRVSMMTVQAGAAKTIARADLDAAVNAMGDVEQAGRQALGELRHLLGVLRPEIADPDDLGPQPGLADVETLADQLTHTGADVTLTIADRAHDLPAAIDLSAYRIVQESLTNIIKHAGPDPTVAVTIGVDQQGLVIEITNSAETAPPSLPASGYGIAGMRERAHLLGGTLTAGPQLPDRYRVHARLPLEFGAKLTLRVAVVDDQALVRRGFAMVLDHQSDIDVVAEAGTGLEAIEATRQHRPDIVLMDIRMPEMDGLTATAAILEEADWPLKVIILTTFDPDEYVYRALQAGASGFVLKDIPPEDLAPAVRAVADGGALLDPTITRRLIARFAQTIASDTATAKRLDTLTSREREVLTGLARGSTNAEISDALYIGAATVKSHVSNILTKLGLRDRAQAVVFAYESGLITPGDHDIGH